MKKITFILVSIFICCSFVTNAQERQNEVRQKLSASMDAQSEILSNISGWSLIENTEGKIWKQSDFNDEISYLPAYKKSFAGFYSIQLFKFTIEGQHFCVLLKNIDKKNSKYFVFTQDELNMLIKATVWKDGQSRLNNEYVVDLKYCDYVNGYFDPEKEILKNKELIRVLLLNEKRILSSQECAGEKLFNFSLQKIKNETVIRFNFLLDLNENQPFSPRKDILPITNDYFETKLSNFTRLLNFSPYISYLEREQKSELLDKQKDSLQFLDYLKYYEVQNSISYKKWQEYESKNITENKCIELKNSYPMLLKDNVEFLTPYIDSSKIVDREEFEIIVNYDGSVKYSPKQMNFFKKLKFTPGTIQVYYGNDFQNQYFSFSNCNGKCKTINRTMSIPVAFFKKNVRAIVSKFIVKFKKTNNGVTIENQYFTDKELFEIMSPQIMVDKNFEKLKNGKYYIYYTRSKFVWNLITFPKEYERYRSGFATSKEDYVRLTNDFYTYSDNLDLKIYDSSNIEKLCP